MADVGLRPVISDARIAALLAEPKRLPANWLQRLSLGEEHRGHRGSELEVVGDDGNTFEIRLRQSTRDFLAFSAILMALDLDGIRRFRLRRYNGRSHGHRNQIEGSRLAIGFHIHTATERYQRAGFDEDAFAEATDRYSDLWVAVECLIGDCGFIDEQAQGRLL